jgi:hypothetical protein
MGNRVRDVLHHLTELKDRKQFFLDEEFNNFLINQLRESVLMRNITKNRATLSSRGSMYNLCLFVCLCISVALSAESISKRFSFLDSSFIDE